MRTPEARAALKKVFDDPASSSRLKMGAAMGLARMGDASGAEHALQAILSRDGGYLPVMILKTLKDKSGVPRIREAMATRSPYDAEKLRMVLVELEAIGEDEDERAGRIASAIEESASPRDLCWQLLRLRTPKAFKKLYKLTKSKNKNAAFEASFALEHSMLTGEVPVSEVKAAIGNTKLVKMIEKLLTEKKTQPQP
jgi:hypothetical protein